MSLSESKNSSNQKINLAEDYNLESVTASSDNLIKIKKLEDNTSNLKFNKLRGLEDLYQTVAKSTVYIAAAFGEEEYGEGSGVIINSNEI